MLRPAGFVLSSLQKAELESGKVLIDYMSITILTVMQQKGFPAPPSQSWMQQGVTTAKAWSATLQISSPSQSGRGVTGLKMRCPALHIQWPLQTLR